MLFFQDYFHESCIRASMQTKKTRKLDVTELPPRNSIRRTWLPIGEETFSQSLVFRKNPVIREEDIPSVSILLRDASPSG